MDKSSFFPPRPPRPTNEAEWIYYTVEDAERILAHLNEGNRRLDAGNVSLLVRAHDRDGLSPYSESLVVFDEDGNLINGQHRLLALTVTGKGSWLYTMKNVPRDALALIDNGKPRSVADALTFNGNNKKATLLGSVIRHYILVQTGRLYRNSSEHKVSNAEVVDLVNTHPEFEVACDLGNRIAAKVGCGATGLAVAWLLIRQANPGASHVVDQFFDKLETRANEPIGSAIHALANRLHKAENDKTNRNSTRPLRPQEVEYAVISGWNAWVHGIPRQKIQTRPSGGRAFRLPAIQTHNLASQF